MAKSPRILILSASVGAGHLRAAEAVEKALRITVPDATVKNVDVLDLTNRVFRRVYGKLYLDLVNQAPHVLGYFYDMMDRPTRGKGDRMRLVIQKLNLKVFIRFLQEEAWDLVINTHFLPAEIIASLRKQRELTLPQVTVTTDFDTHRLWVNQPCERYFTATEEGALYLHTWGVPTQDIRTTGIPIDPVFAESKDRAACRARHGLAEERPVILQLAGGFGVGPIANYYRALLDVEVPMQLATVAGRNEALKTELEKIACPPQHRTKVFGFTREIDELMAAADLVVSKPGGLTTSETLARGAVMVIVNPIPGQESRNSDFLLENGAAVKANSTTLLTHKVTALLKDPKRMEFHKANVRRVARPRAAFAVVEQALALIGKAPVKTAHA